ncbi:hypothetical protein [Streptomyces chartreusis]
MNDLFALLALVTALRVFLPDLRTGIRCMLRAGARVGIAELLASGSADASGTRLTTKVVSRDWEA